MAMPQIEPPKYPPSCTNRAGPKWSSARSPKNRLTIMASAKEAKADAYTPFSYPISSRNKIAPQSLAAPSPTKLDNKPTPNNQSGITLFPNSGILASCSSSPLWPSIEEGSKK